MVKREQVVRAAPWRAGHVAEDELEARPPTPLRAIRAREPQPRARASDAVRRQGAAGLAAELRGRAALRRAMLLQEILGPPVSLRGEDV